MSNILAGKSTSYHDDFGSIMQSKANTSLDSTGENDLSDDSFLDDDAFLDMYGHMIPN